jgi:tetratricopeptide (TPR) repeat protein
VRCVGSDGKPDRDSAGAPALAQPARTYMMTIDLSRKVLFRPLMFALPLLLAACATGPGSAQRSRSGAPEQPLQRLTVPQPAPSEDALTNALAAEFALANTDLGAAARDYAQAAQASDDPAIAAQATRVAIAAKQWDAARTTLARWEQLKPNDSGIHQVRALLALHDDKIDDAYQDLLALAREPEARGWRTIAQTLLDAPEREQAGVLLERLATPELLGGKVETWIAASQLAQRLQRKPLAQTLADKTVAKFASADAYAWAAQLKFQNGERDAARALFRQAVQHDPKNVHLRASYAALLGELGDYAEAVRVLTQGPQDDYTYAARAAYAARADDKTLLDPLYKELKAAPPPRSGARLNLLGELAELLDQKSEALAWYEQVPGEDEHWFESRMRSTLLLDGQGKSADALTLVHELEARAGDDAKQLGDVFLLEGEIVAKHNKDERAIAVYDRGLKALPDDTRLLYARALLEDELNKVDAAVRDLRRVLELKPNDADAMNALGYTLADRTDKKDEALLLIQRAMALKPGEPAIIDSLGWVQYRLGNLDQALTQLKQAYQKQPDAEIAAHLGEVLWAAGQKDEARKVWEQGRKKDAANKVLLDTIKRLSS